MSENTPKLLPCPFCGAEPEHYINSVICTNGELCGAFIHDRNHENLFKSWNTRPTPDTGIGQGEAVWQTAYYEAQKKFEEETLRFSEATRKAEAWKEYARQLESYGLDGYSAKPELKKAFKLLESMGEPMPLWEKQPIASPFSAPALKQEACGECGGSGEVSDGGHKDLEMMVTCESCGGSGKETK